MNVIFSCDVSFSTSRQEGETYSILDFGNLYRSAMFYQRRGWKAYHRVLTQEVEHPNRQLECSRLVKLNVDLLR
jgi:hypothetical protein